jgi:hypothetical protein
MYMPTCANAGAVIAEAKIKLAIHLIFIVLSPYNDLTYDANPVCSERFRDSLLFLILFQATLWCMLPMAAHPLAVLGFEPVTSLAQKHPRSLTELGFETVTNTFARPQAVGAMELASRRKIVQPTDSPAINQALATEAMPAYKARLLQAIRHVPGARLAASRDRKNPARLAEKIAGQGQPAETVSDYGAAQIAVASIEAKDAVVAAVKRLFPVLRQQDNFTFGDPEYHYRSYSLQLQMPNGSSEELQIVPKEVLEANRQEHHDYKKVRNAELAGRTADQARVAARFINDSAMERFNSRNGAERVVKGPIVKGARVRLAGGALARVLYVDPNMRIVRVRTESGRNITVRQKDLKS